MEKISQNTISYSNKIQEIIDTFNQQIDTRSSGQTKIKSISQYNKIFATDITPEITDVRNNIIGKSVTYGTCTTVRSVPKGYSSTTISKHECLDATRINDIINDVNLLLEQCGCNSYLVDPEDTCNHCAHCGHCSCQSTCCNTVTCNNSYKCTRNSSCYDCCNYDDSNCCDGDCSYSAGCSEGDGCSECAVCGDGRCTTDYCRCNTVCIHTDCSCDNNSCCDSYCSDCCDTHYYCCNTVACYPHGTTTASLGCLAQCSCNGNACSCNANCSCNKVCSCNWV